MSDALRPPTTSASLGADAARRIAEEALAAQPGAEGFSAGPVFAQWPQLLEHPTIALELAYEEYCQLSERGAAPAVDDFVAQYPAIADQLREQLRVHQILAVALPEGRAPAVWPTAPGQFLHLELVQALGAGAFAKVFLARDLRLGGRLSAVKISRSAGPEGASLARLTHPNIMPVLSGEYDPESGLEAIVMPLQGRWTMRHAIDLVREAPERYRRSGALWRDFAAREDLPASLQTSATTYAGLAHDDRPLQELFIGWAVQIAEALALAHSHGFVHCDVKPSNILIGWDGRAILMDFNVARSLHGKQAPSGGTVAYMAPEQLSTFLRQGPSDEPISNAPVDLFGLGATLYELFTTRLPFGMPAETETRTVALQQQLAARSAGAPPLHSVCRSLPADLCRVVDACLQPSPLYRPTSAAAVAQRFKAYFALRRRLARAARRHPVRAALSLMLAAAVGTAVIRALPSSDGAVAQAQAAYAAGDLAAAYQHFDRALQWNSRSVAAREGLVATLLRQEQFDAALQQLAQLPDDPYYDRCRAYALMRTKQKQAQSIYDRLLASGAATAADYSNAGYCRFISNELDAAQSLARQALARDPALDEAWTLLIMIEVRFLQLRRPQQLDEVVEEVLQQQHQERQVSLWRHLTVAIAMMGRAAEDQGDTVLRAKRLEQLCVACRRIREAGGGRESITAARTTWPNSFRDNAELRKLEATASEGGAAAPDVLLLISPIDTIHPFRPVAAAAHADVPGVAP